VEEASAINGGELTTNLGLNLIRIWEFDTNSSFVWANPSPLGGGMGTCAANFDDRQEDLGRGRGERHQREVGHGRVPHFLIHLRYGKSISQNVSIIWRLGFGQFGVWGLVWGLVWVVGRSLPTLLPSVAATGLPRP